MNKKVFYAAMFLIAAFAACKPGKENEEPEKPEVKAVPTPDFNSDSAYLYVQKQVDFGPRVPGSKAHKEAEQWLTAKLKQYTPDVMVQEGQATVFDGSKKPIRNIVASFNTDKRSRVMLAAHWDTRPFSDQDSVRQDEPIDGANDGGSGVGILLEIARQLSKTSPNIGVDIILFDLEDYGQPESSTQKEQENTYCLGAQYWSKHKHKSNYLPRYGILLDMVGAKNARFTMEGTSMHYAPHIVKKVWDTANRIGYSDYFAYDQTNPITDDHLYVNSLAGIGMIDIIEYDTKTKYHFSKTWHTHGDNMDVIDKNTLKAVGQTLLEVVFTER